ncbi:MAG: hypothetical protein V1837_05740 [Candidatus Woesearchaeota archaeon]
MALTIQPPKPPSQKPERQEFTFSVAPAKLDQKYDAEEKFIATRKEDLEKREQVIKLREEAYKREIADVEDSRKRLDAEIQERRIFLQNMERELGEKQELLWQKEQTLQKKEKLLKDTGNLKDAYLKTEISALREKAGLPGMDETLKTKADLLKRKEELLKNYEQSLKEFANSSSAKADESLNEDLRKHMEMLQTGHDTIQDRQTALNRIEKDLEDKEARISKQENQLNQIRSLLEAKETELSKKEGLLREHFENMEHDNTEQESSKLETPRPQELTGERLPETIAKLGKIREEWEIKEGMLKEKSARVLEDKVKVERMLEKIEADVSLLDGKEEDILQKIDTLERDKKLLDKEEEQIIAKVRKLEFAEEGLKKREATVKEFERTIGKEEQRITEAAKKVDNAKEYQKEIPKLERHYNKLRKQYLKIEEEALAKSAMIKREHETLTQKETDLEAREIILKQKESQLISEEYELIHAKETLEKGILHDYAPTEMIGTPVNDTIQYAKMQALVNKARDDISKGALDEAKRTVDAIENLMQSMQEGEKRQLVYDLMELKTDIRLATL